MPKLFINENKKVGKIHEEIYGHFAEHLGRCIYEGLYVGRYSIQTIDFIVEEIKKDPDNIIQNLRRFLTKK